MRGYCHSRGFDHEGRLDYRFPLYNPVVRTKEKISLAIVQKRKNYEGNYIAYPPYMSVIDILK